MILSTNNINKTYIDNHVLKDISFHINENDKAAIIGANGCGKTTLLRIIMGLENADSGDVIISKDTSIGYLAQNSLVDSERNIYDEVLSVKYELIELEEKIASLHSLMDTLTGEELDNVIAKHTQYTQLFEQKGGYMYKSEVKGVLLGLGFKENDFDKSVNTLSGGQKTRVALSKLLIDKPDLIILDEPTNHLDMSSVLWLENYLLNYKGSVLLVSHDRYFLDKIVNKVIEIEFSKAQMYEGNYSEYSVKKEFLRISAMNAYVKQQADIKHQEEVIKKLRSFNREKSIKRAESRVKMLEKIDRLEKPQQLNDEMQLALSPRFESGKDVLSVVNLTKSYNSNNLFKDLSFEIKRGEHIAIIGDNGTGKTTLLKILNELESQDNGTFRLGSNVCIGYYDQEHHVLHDDNTIFDEISNAFPSLNNTTIRNVLAAFLFTGDDVYKKISALSGGEKGRVSLSKLMLSEANFLILDEPTNHLDITSKEILETAINNYEGTLLYVSHDRYFINRTADKILELKNKTFYEYLGNYDYYLEKKTQNSVSLVANSNNESKETEVKADWKAQKEASANLRKLQNRLSSIEKEIEDNEKKKEELNNEILLPQNATNSAKLNELTQAISKIDEMLNKLMEEWEEISEQLS